MFSVFLADGPVRDFDDAQRQDTAAYAAFFHAMLDRGVYLPPSAYEAWFLSVGPRRRRGADRHRRTAGRCGPRPGRRAVADRATETTVHLIRHGEVHNPEGVLYGRRDGYHLSDLGRDMAERVAKTLGDRDIVHLRRSPLERAQETAAPLARRSG